MLNAVRGVPSFVREDTPLIEITGRVKWFDLSKGYGFIMPKNDLRGDVLVHVTCLRRCGVSALNEGATVRVQVEERPKGLQAVEIVWVDESTAVSNLKNSPLRTHVQVEATHGPVRAWCKWFNRLKGYGFLTRGEGTPDIFVHMEVLRRHGVFALKTNQEVSVCYGQGPRGLMAAEVRPA